MSRFKIALLAAIVLSVGIFSLSGQEAVNDKSPTSSEYGCLVVSQVLSNRPQYTWYEPSRTRQSGRPPAAASDIQMAAFLGIKDHDKKNESGFVNTLTRKGWQLVDVEREHPRPTRPQSPDSSGYTPYYVRYHFTRPVR